jgi:hypothetical protein
MSDRRANLLSMSPFSRSLDLVIDARTPMCGCMMCCMDNSNHLSGKATTTRA